MPPSSASTKRSWLLGENGCDSTVTLTLTVLPLAHTALDASICANETYEYGGETFTDPGAYTFTFEGENGCDSTVTLNLTVLPIAETLLVVSVCAGESYEYNGEMLTEAGDYPFGFTAENGCDSTVTVRLGVLQISIPADAWVALAKSGGQKTMEDVYTDIGLGKRLPSVVARRLLAREDMSADSPSNMALAIHGTEGMAIQLARCCQPIPGDPIIGSIKKGSGAPLCVRSICLIAIWSVTEGRLENG